jgi:uncharacterized RDD family membrane protein YckC
MGHLLQPLRQGRATMTMPDSPAAAAVSADERAAKFFEGGRRLKREIVTPEGVPVTIDIADYGERLVAFTIDFVIWTLLTLAIYIPVLSLIGRTRGNLIAISIALFIGFLIRNLYFVYFELAWRGATPGKRIVGLRVIDRNGGPLVAPAVIARNLTREVEMFIPIGVLMHGGRSINGTIDWQELVVIAWVLFCLAIPASNRDRMRGGDLIAGTMVISLPKRVLLSDLVESALQFTFAPAQLQAYGAFELQVLEELLRRPRSTETVPILEDVCDKICRKIGWTGAVPRSDVAAFLRDFYTAQRAYLEREQLYGKAKADKYAAPAASG